MARLYADENFPLPVVDRLRELGHDVVTVQETGAGERPQTDPQVLDYASAQGRAVLTMNRRHFFKLHAEGRLHRGIIACTHDADFVGQAQRVHEAIANSGPSDGTVIRVNRPPK